MPKFIRVETDSGVKFVNVDDIRQVKPNGNKEFEVIYAFPGSPCSSKLYVSLEELHKTYELSEIC